jgi:predicted RND superfamily exporter protein
MKIKLLTPLSGVNGSFGVGEVIEVDKNEAIRLIEKELAEPVNKKEFATLIAKLEKEKRAKEEAQKLAEVQSQKEKAEAELNGLYARVVELEAYLAGVTLTDEEKFQAVEELKNRDLKGKNKK